MERATILSSAFCSIIFSGATTNRFSEISVHKTSNSPHKFGFNCNGKLEFHVAKFHIKFSYHGEINFFCFRGGQICHLAEL